MAQKVKVVGGDTPKKDVWYKSRRLWGAILSAGAAALVIFFPDKYDLIAGIFATIASGLGVTSWVMPKK